LGYIIGFLTIFLIFTSNLMVNHQNFSTAYPVVNEIALDQLSKFSTIPIKNVPDDFGTSFVSMDPNNQEWKNRLCESTNQAGINIGIPFICDPSNNQQNGNNNQQNGNNNQQDQDTNDNVNDDGIRNDDNNNEKKNNFTEQQLSDQQGDDNAKSEVDEGDAKGNNDDGSQRNSNNADDGNNNIDDNNDNNESNDDGNQRNSNNADDGNNDDNDDNGNKVNNQGTKNDDRGLGIAGLDLGLNLDETLDDVDEKVDKLRDKITDGNNLGLGKQQEEEENEKNNDDQGNNERSLGINGLGSNIQNIQANLEKQIEKLKDKFENERDNQRLIEQRNEFDDDDDDDTDDGDDDGDDGDGDDYDGYGFKGDDGNGNGNGNGEENFNFAAAGDFGCSTNTQNTVENMQSKDPEIVLALGDLSYHSTADCWFDMMSPIKDKLMITLGHHDVEDGQAKMNQYMNSFGIEKPFYSYDYNKVHFLVMSAKSVYYKGSEQYNFILDDLKKASENENINWIIVSSYGPPYTSPSEHPAFKDLREVYHPIFEQYGVDLVLSGHNHNYQRTYPLTYNPNDSGEPTVTSTAVTDYDGQKDGIVFAIVGTGGVNFYSFNGQAPFVDSQFADKFGFLNIDVSNGNPDSKLTGTFYDNQGGQILDQFTIQKELENKNSQIITS
jgi:Calcineurin-like phosphoesterase